MIYKKVKSDRILQKECSEKNNRGAHKRAPLYTLLC
jgi:hypothetical protein